MDFVENIGVSKEGTEAGFGAEQDRPSAVFGAGIVSGVCVTEDSSAQGDELAEARFRLRCH